LGEVVRWIWSYIFAIDMGQLGVSWTLGRIQEGIDVQHTHTRMSIVHCFVEQLAFSHGVKRSQATRDRTIGLL
jgi:hypothetical protein